MPVKHDVTYLPSIRTIGDKLDKLIFLLKYPITTYLVSLLLYQNFYVSPFCQSAMIERAEKIKIILIQFFLDFKGSECLTEVPSMAEEMPNQYLVYTSSYQPLLCQQMYQVNISQT
jgi:hypothetical protein